MTIKHLPTLFVLPLVALALALPVHAGSDSRADEPTLPWTVENEQAFIVQGMKLTYDIEGLRRDTEPVTWTVDAVDEDGFRATRTAGDADDSELGGEATADAKTRTFAWGWLAERIKGTTTGSKKLKVNGETIETTTYSKKTRKEGEGEISTVLYLSARYAGVPVGLEVSIKPEKEGRDADKEKKARRMYTLSRVTTPMGELQGQLPYTNEDCVKFFKVGMVLVYDFIEDAKLNSSRGDETAPTPAPYTIEILEVGKTGYTAKIPTSWSNGQITEYEKKVFTFAGALDAMQEFLEGAQVDGDKYDLGGTVIDCTSITGKRSFGHFTEDVKLSFAKSYPGVLLFKEVSSTDAEGGGKRLTRLALTAIKRP